MRESKKMKVGIFVTAAFCRKGYLDAISGHVQIPLMAAKILADAGHKVTLVTTKPRVTDVLPNVIPENVIVHVVDHASKLWPENGPILGKALKQAWQLLSFLKSQSFDVVHFFGGDRTGRLLALLKSLGIKSQGFFSPIKGPGGSSAHLLGKVTKMGLRRIDMIVATTDYVRHSWALLLGEDKCRLLHPGITKDIHMPSDNVLKNSVLFWRNAGYENGADLAMKSFRELAPRYPDIRFVFAVRPHDVLENELLALQRCVSNIDVHIYPYKPGMSLANLLHNALFVVQPFRSLSLNPQMSILETLYAGVPVIATRVESNEELVMEGKNGLLIPPDDKNALSRAIETLLQDRKLLDRLVEMARILTKECWNWESFGKGLLRIYENTDN
ncbi:D-inositol-3-phosphate glycosyltransferase [subsurface metagenome]